MAAQAAFLGLGPVGWAAFIGITYLGHRYFNTIDDRAELAGNRADLAGNRADLVRWVVIGGGLYVSYRALQATGALK